ncbi:MAG: hypothetical protein FJ271_32880, partial [Planctomycetes bacterium]|nr:hypothetical protein [Planctomycetota bacterium]
MRQSHVLSRRRLLAAAPVALAAACAGTGEGGMDRPAVRVQLDTAQGLIEIEVQQDRVPKVAAWFFGLVATGSFDETQFFRVGHLAGQPDRPRFIEG